MSKNYTIDNTIDYADYRAIRAAVGFREVSERQFELALKNSRYIAVAKDGGKSVGLIKAAGDDGFYWVIADLAILPEYQGQGLGRRLLDGFLDYAKSQARIGENVFISLLAASGKESFYEKFGFKTRPYDSYGAGMSLHFTNNG